MLYLKQVLNLDNAKLKRLQPNRLDGVAAGFLLACLSLFRIFFQLVAEIYQRLVGLGRCQTRWVFIGADKFDPVDEIFAHLNEVRYGAIPDRKIVSFFKFFIKLYVDDQYQTQLPKFSQKLNQIEC